MQGLCWLMNFFLCERKREWAVEQGIGVLKWRITEWLRWEVKVIRSTSPAQAGPPRASWPGLCSNSFLIPPRMKIFTTSLGNLWECTLFFIDMWNQRFANSGGKKSKYIVSDWSSYVYCCIYMKHLYISKAISASIGESEQVGVHLWYSVYTSMSFKGS